MTAQEILAGSNPVICHYINGAVVADNTRLVPVMNPATGAVEKQVAMASKTTVACAIAAAQAAFPAWRDTTPLKRARIMFRFKELLEQHADTIAGMITAEHGKVFEDARGEFMRGVEIVEYACGAPELLKGEHSKNVGPGIDSWSEFQPLGVVAGITPFNFPAMVPMDLRQHPAAHRAGGAFSGGTAGRRERHSPSRQPRPGTPPRCRAAAETRATEGAGGDRVTG